MRYAVAIAMMLAIASPVYAADMKPVAPPAPPKIDIVPSAFDNSGGDTGPTLDSLTTPDEQAVEKVDTKKPEETQSAMAGSTD